jgi:hypothetical protein
MIEVFLAECNVLCAVGLFVCRRVCKSVDAGVANAPGVYLRDDPVSGIQLENLSELRAPTARHAAFYLDAAIAARTIPGGPHDMERVL